MHGMSLFVRSTEAAANPTLLDGRSPLHLLIIGAVLAVIGLACATLGDRSEGGVARFLFLVAAVPLVVIGIYAVATSLVGHWWH